jgi:hypothetical protein
MAGARLLLVLAVACRSSESPPKPQPEHVPEVPPVEPVDASVWSTDPLPLPVGERADTAPIGGSNPILWATADPKRRWTVTCEQRNDTNGNGAIDERQIRDLAFVSGDTPSLYLVLGSGAGLAIDALHAISPTGDHLVVSIENAYALVDVEAHLAHRLPATTTQAIFSGDGKRLVYISGAEIVRRDLSTGLETRRALPRGVPVAMDLDTSGRWLVIALARGGERGVRYLDVTWPQGWTCELGLPHLGKDLREPAEKVWIDLDRGDVNEDQSIVRIVGDHVISRPALDRVVVDGKPAGPKDCTRMQVVGVHEAPFAILLQCVGTKSRVVLVGPRTGSWNEVLMPIDVIRQLAPMVHEREDCMVLGDACLDVVSGVRRPREFVLFPMGEHGDEAWYDGTRTHLLVGSAKHGPLHWRLQDRGDR